MLEIILVAAVVVVVLLVVVIAMRPSEFKTTRTARISAPAGVVFENVNDLHKWEAWSPWAKMDPNAKSTFRGSPAGLGASMAWAGNNKVGEGSMTITESRPNERIRLKLEFLKPFKASNDGEFAFQSEGAQTLVTWSMSGRNNFMFKAVGLFMNCDKMVGDQFERGLASLDSVSQAAAKR
jgi:hypothetical protein